jgi:acetylglutamate/LysW-gamma-L-alpha-aminoadipate kinase
MSAGITVVKCGGGDEVAWLDVCADVGILRRGGEQVILVHGGGRDIERLAGQLGVPARTLVAPDGTESRYTDRAMLDVLTLAMAGRVKPRLLAALAASGVTAVGLTGVDAGMLRAVRKPARRSVVGGRTFVVRDDHSGRIVDVDTTLLRVLLRAGLTPVVSPPAAGPDGRALAAALRARRLLLLTAAPGVLADAADPSSVLSHCVLPRAGALEHAVTSGMYRKLVAAREALDGPQVVVADGRVRRPAIRACQGGGTAVVLQDQHPVARR